VGGFCFPKTRVEWRVEWSGGEEKRRECDVWPQVEWRVEWSGVEEKRRKEFVMFGRCTAARVFYVLLVTCLARGLARFGPRAGPTGYRVGRAGLSRVGGLNFLTRPMLFWSGWRAGPSGPAHFDIPIKYTLIIHQTLLV